MEFDNELFTFRRDFSSKLVSQNEHIFINSDGKLCLLQLTFDNNSTLSQVKSGVLHDFEREVMSISGTSNFYIALQNDGKVYAWGSNCFGQCGQSDLNEYFNSPTQIVELENIIQISTGLYHGVALDNTGYVWRWGTVHNLFVSQSWEDSPHDKPYKLNDLRDIIWINCGQDYFYALDRRGILWGYGLNYNNELGDLAPQFVDSPIIVFDNFQNVSSVHTCYKEAYGITYDNKLIRWIFKNGSSNSVAVKPTVSAVLRDVIAITTTSSNGVALLDTGELWSWGDDYFAVLGRNVIFDINENNFFTPRKIDNIPLLPNSTVISNFVGLSLYNDDTIWGWGSHISSCTPMKILPEIIEDTRTPIRTRTAYKEYYIGFLDILGFKEMILNRKYEKSILVKSQMDLLNNADRYFKSFGTNIMIMSDSLIITIPIEVENSLEYFLYVLAEINGMINQSVLRGAISIGELYHQEGVIFGPSFISAYQQQEFEAIYPRIIIKSEDIKEISLISELNSKIMDKYFILDDDNKIFFDYLSYLKDYPFREYALSRVMNSVTNAILINYLGVSNVNKKISEKYKWLLKYLFIWNIKNRESYKGISFQKFDIIHYGNCYEIENLQNCMVEFYHKLIIRFDEYLLLTDNEFPSNILDEINFEKTIDYVKSNLIENIIFTDVHSIDYFKRFSVRVFNSQHEKRSIFEISHFSCFEVSSMELRKTSAYKWTKFNEINSDQYSVLKKFFNDL